MNDEMSRQIYLEREFHRVVLERDTLRTWSWIWSILALTGWGALIAVAFKTGILRI